MISTVRPRVEGKDLIGLPHWKCGLTRSTSSSLFWESAFPTVLHSTYPYPSPPLRHSLSHLTVPEKASLSQSLGKAVRALLLFTPWSLLLHCCQSSDWLHFSLIVWLETLAHSLLNITVLAAFWSNLSDYLASWFHRFYSSDLMHLIHPHSAPVLIQDCSTSNVKFRQPLLRPQAPVLTDTLIPSEKPSSSLRSSTQEPSLLFVWACRTPFYKCVPFCPAWCAAMVSHCSCFLTFSLTTLFLCPLVAPAWHKTTP